MNAQPHPFIIGPGPHVRSEESTGRIMWWVNGTLAPAALWGVLVFGLPALVVIVASVAGTLAAEWGVGRLMRYRPSPADGSAVCTGLLMAMTLPPLTPFWMAFLGGLFAIVFGKMIFGGLGYNLFNPALIGRAFMLATFPVPMTGGWAAPQFLFGPQLDAVTTPTPLAALRERGLAAALETASGLGSAWLGLAVGWRPGSIGEVSVLLLAVGGGVLLWKGIIRPTIPLAIFAGVAVSSIGNGPIGLHLMAGGLWLGALFMATDYVTSPKTRDGQVVFGLVIGLLTGLIRRFGGYPEGICYAILLANTLVPALNTWFRPPRPKLAGVMS